MLANGPPCTKTGECSRVCTRLGCRAFASRIVSASCASRSAAVTGTLSRVWPTTIRPMRSLRSASDVARQKIAISSLATTMSHAVLAGEPVAGAAQPHHDLAQRPVVHVDDPLPGDRARVDAERVAVVDVVVDQGGQQVVGRRDRREVAGEVEVDVGHRHHLGVAAPGGAALHPEHRPHAGLAQRRRRPDADVAQPVGEADHRGGLALTGRGRRDGRDQHQPARRSALEGRQPRPVELRHVAAVRDQRLVGHAELLLGDPADRPQLGRLGDLYVAGQVAGHLAGHLALRPVRQTAASRPRARSSSRWLGLTEGRNGISTTSAGTGFPGVSA